MKLFNRTVIPSDHPFVVNKYTQWYYDIIHNALFRKDKNVDYLNDTILFLTASLCTIYPKESSLGL